MKQAFLTAINAHISVDSTLAAVKISQYENSHQVAVLQVDFPSQAALIGFFAQRLIGDPMMKGHSSKAIGATLLIWRR